MKKYICTFFFLFLIFVVRAQWNLEAVTYGSDTFMAIASNGEVLSSEDGIHWSSTPAPAGNWQDITYDKGRYVIVGPYSAMTSPDGENWTVHPVPAGNWVAVVSNGSLYVATSTGGGNYVMTSSDGATWAARTPAHPWSHNDVAYGSIDGTDRFVSVCQLGRGWIASDPTGTWSIINPGAIVDIRTITYGNGKFVWLQWATEGTAYAAVSTNGTNFVSQISAVVNQWNSMAYGNNMYVAVASGGLNTRAAYSADGVAWSYGTGVEANAWQSVAYGNGVFVAIANSGDNRIMYSNDGIQWDHDVVLPSTVQVPSITSFTPGEAATGGEVSITGTQFEDITSVQFGGVEATSFTLGSETTITAIVPFGAVSGDITVINSAGGHSLSGFIYNAAPTDISLPLDPILENNALDDVLGQFSGTDPNSMDTLSFGLVAGIGDTDNDSFSISGSNLRANAVYDFEANREYTIRVEVQDNYGNAFQKAFMITIADVNESPTDILLDYNRIMENSGIGTPVGNLNTIDPDRGNVHTYTLVPGNGINDVDNASFTIEGTDLKLAVIPDFESQSTYTINIHVNDGANNYQKSFEITVLDENEDLDGDGVDNGLDQCPNTPIGEAIDENGCSESQRDTDGDGTFDHADEDDDNDGTLDEADAFPKDPTEDTDTDGDGIGDQADEDDDNDGTLDEADAFPKDPTEDTDTDGDGIGDQADDDDDNDGILDGDDAFPKDPTEDSDADGDGIGDQADHDDDNDGILDGDDAFPKDPTEDTDMDGDGIGDQADDDDDNDGILDGDDAFPTSDGPSLVPAQAFTPNSDGNNDAWIIPGIDNYPNHKVSVYNRWGHEVFVARSYKNDWEGFHKGRSERLPAGSYLYIIDLGDGHAPLQGWIFINY